MDEFDLIVGIHSIAAVITENKRKSFELVGTEEAFEQLKKTCDLTGIKTTMYSNHKVQEESKHYFKDLGLEYQRVPSNIFLVCEPLLIMGVDELYKLAEHKKNLRILCLDQISDVHNAGAIMRSACFYNVDVVVIPDQRSFGLTPSFYRIASGAIEYLKLVRVSKLTKTISKLQEVGVKCIAMSEHAQSEFSLESFEEDANICIIVGKEDTGISNAVLRVCENKMSITSQGEIKSLNVSIATAIALEKCFGKQ